MVTKGMIINWAKALGGFIALNFGKWFAEQGNLWVGAASAIFGVVLVILSAINMAMNIRNKELERKETKLRIKREEMEIDRISKNAN